MGEFSLLENHNFVLHVAVHKLNPEVFPDCCDSTYIPNDLGMIA